MLSKIAKVLIVAELLVTMSYLLSPPSALAIGVGVSPKELNFSIRSGGSTKATLCVINTGDREARYKVYVDEEYEGWFDISPAEFSLASQAYKEVQIAASPPLFSFSDHNTYIYVAAINPSSQLGMGAGVKVPVHIHISNLPLWIAIGATAALLASLTTFLIRRRRKMHAAK
jgi:hypothetical protein